MREPSIQRRLLVNGLFRFAICGLAAAALVPLFLILADVFRKGSGVLSWDFLTSLPKATGESGGGIANAIVGTLMLIGIASLLAVPLGIAAGVYLSEVRKSRLAYFTRLAVDILQGMPSVVIGIIAYLWLVRSMGRFTALSGGMALALMMLPLVVRGTEEVLKLVPAHLKEASLALGVPHYRTVLRVIIPCGLPGIISAVLLGVSRIAGETAPLLFTAFGNRFLEFSPLKPVGSLPLTIFTYAMSPYEDLQAQAWGASVVLILLVLVTNIIARIVITRWKIQF
jgi:phosphate transport system permease protein